MSVVSDALLLRIATALEGGGSIPLLIDGVERAVSVATATIANAASLSDVIAFGGYRLVGLVMPAAWTSAALSFSGSPDGGTYSDVFDGAAERSISAADMAASVGKLVTLDRNDWRAMTHLKLRSGLTGAAVNQGAARSFTAILERGV